MQMKKTRRLVCGFFCKNKEKDDCVKYSMVCWLSLMKNNINEIGYIIGKIKTQFVILNFLLLIKKIYMFYKILLQIRIFVSKVKIYKAKQNESIFVT